MSFFEDLSDYETLLDSLSVPSDSNRKVRHVLNFSDRKKIQRMLKDGRKVTDIAAALDVTPATIYRDIQRRGHPYIAEIAHGLTH